VRLMLGSLPAQHQEIIIATYFRRRTIREAAGQLGLAPDTARARLYEAMRDLSDMVATRWPGRVGPDARLAGVQRATRVKPRPHRRRRAESGRSGAWAVVDCRHATGPQLDLLERSPRRKNEPVSDYRLSEDPADLDMPQVARWIGTDAYWAKGRSHEVIERSFANSVPAGVYAADGRQVAVARIVSDGATIVWLCDVYVDRNHRGRGLGTMLAGWAVEWAERHGIKRVLLATVDAHGVYAKAGFTPVRHPERWMEIDTRPPFG